MDRREVPPYGPLAGMVAGIHLLERGVRGPVDEATLRAAGIAPGNEYKVLGALRYLGLIDADGRETVRARQLRSRGAVRTLALQDMVRAAYAFVFTQLDLRRATADDVHNLFVARGLRREMATKATRFFLELCRLAELPVPASTRRRGRPPREPRPAEPDQEGPASAPAASPALTVSLQVDAALLEWPEERLAAGLAKLLRAWRRAQRST